MGGGFRIQNQFPERINNIFNELEEVKYKIAYVDSKALKQEASKTWKDHKKIISIICGRTKPQLLKMASVFEKCEADDGYTCKLDNEIWAMLGGIYGNLMRSFVLPKKQIDAELLNSSLSSIGCDEMQLAETLCTCTSAMITDALKTYEDNYKESIQDKIRTKTTKNSSFQTFILKILSTPRRMDVSIDDVQKNGDMMHTFYETSNEFDSMDSAHMTTLDLISVISREECYLISQYCNNTYGVTLDVILFALFKDTSIQRALELWICRDCNMSLAILFQYNIKNNLLWNKLSLFIAMYDKSIIKQIAIEYFNIYSYDLLRIFVKHLNGNFKNAIVYWMTNDSYDCGYEAQLHDLCMTHIENNNNEINDRYIEKIENLLQIELQNASMFAKEYCIENDIKSSVIAECRRKEIEVNHDSTDGNKIDSKVRRQSSFNVSSANRRRASTFSVIPEKLPPSIESDVPSDVNGAESGNVMPSIDECKAYDDTYDYEGNAALIRGYLEDKFKQADINGYGYLDKDQFHATLSSMRLGYTSDEITAIQLWIDTDNDGIITYEEILDELSYSFIEIIENGLGVSVKEKIEELHIENQNEIDLLWEQYESWAKQEKITDMAKNDFNADNQYSTTMVLSPDLLTYMKNTFEACDENGSGKIEVDKFWTVLGSVLNLSEGDKEMLQVMTTSIIIVRCVNTLLMCI
jgi:Ca2+-binding EF-hand superfamily protein